MTKIVDSSLTDIKNALSDVESPYYGGSTAYLTLFANLAFLRKLLSIRESKDLERANTYNVIKLLLDDLMEDSRVAINEDPLVFSAIMKKDRDDDYIHEVVLKQISFITNLITLKTYVAALSFELKGGIKEDFTYLLQIITVVSDCLKSNIKYEISRIRAELKRVELLEMVISL